MPMSSSEKYDVEREFNIRVFLGGAKKAQRSETFKKGLHIRRRNLNTRLKYLNAGKNVVLVMVFIFARLTGNSRNRINNLDRESMVYDDRVFRC